MSTGICLAKVSGWATGTWLVTPLLTWPAAWPDSPRRVDLLLSESVRFREWWHGYVGCCDFRNTVTRSASPVRGCSARLEMFSLHPACCQLSAFYGSFLNVCLYLSPVAWFIVGFVELVSVSVAAGENSHSLWCLETLECANCKDRPKIHGTRGIRVKFHSWSKSPNSFETNNPECVTKVSRFPQTASLASPPMLHCKSEPWVFSSSSSSELVLVYKTCHNFCVSSASCLWKRIQACQSSCPLSCKNIFRAKILVRFL